MEEELGADAEASGERGLIIGYLSPGVGLLDALAVGQERGGSTHAIDEINAAGGVLDGSRGRQRKPAIWQVHHRIHRS